MASSPYRRHILPREGTSGQKGENKISEDCVIDVARRKGKTLVDMKRLARDRIAFRQWTEGPDAARQ